MRTIVFHSYKGGVGRTLALANLVKALAAVGKRVGLVDLDLEAPGLPFKFNKEGEVRKGYVDYLMETTPQERAGGMGREARIDFLKECMLPLDSAGALQLLPAGNALTPEYWWVLATERFQNLFYLVPEVLNPEEETAGARPDENRRAFVQDLEDIRLAMGDPDYLLVDCKGGLTEIVAAALHLWADVAVTMSGASAESRFGEAMLQQSLLRGWRDRVDKRIVPVLCRVPENFSQQDADKFQLTFRQIIWPSLSTDPGEDDLFQGWGETYSLLHEDRSIEAKERLLLAGEEEKDLQVSLSSDYLDLFKRIAPEIGAELAELGQPDWKSILGMADKVDFMERYFTLHLHSGEMLNDDREPNISLRRDSLRNLMDSIYFDCINQSCKPQTEARHEVDASFRRAGRAAGRSFGREMMQTNKVWQEGAPATFDDRLTKWSEFDSRVGFGRIRWSWIEPPKRGVMDVFDNFLTKGRSPDQPDINQFLCGYMEGVLEYLLGAGEEHVTVSVTASEMGKDSFVFTVTAS